MIMIRNSKCISIIVLGHLLILYYVYCVYDIVWANVPLKNSVLSLDG